MYKEVSGGFLPALQKAAVRGRYCSRCAVLSTSMMKAGSTSIWDDFKQAYNDEAARQKARK